MHRLLLALLLPVALLPAGCAATTACCDVMHPVTTGLSGSPGATGRPALVASPTGRTPAAGTPRWRTGPTLPIAVSEVGVAAVGSSIHVLGGYVGGIAHSTTHLIYDSVHRTWSRGVPLPQRLDHVGAASVGGHLFVFGGYDVTGHASSTVYELAGDHWVTRAPLPLARAAAVTVVLDGLVHVIGGRTPTGDDTDRQDVYDPATNAWSADAPIPGARDHAAGAVLAGRIYVAGGRPGAMSSAEVYDPASDRWSALPSLPTPRNSIAGAAFAGSFVVIGGENSTETGVYATVSTYSPVSGRWSSLPALPHPLQGIGATVIAGVLYLPGGGPSGGGSQQSAQLLTLS